VTLRLTVLICTHNRADLLERVLASLNEAIRPALPVRILVAANACSDDTMERMQAYQVQQSNRGWLPLRILEVPTPGKSHALNQAIPEIEDELVAFVDDDHRVDKDYLAAIERAAIRWPDAALFCGRILPDWDGTEPSWVHDAGPYRIYPLPVPRYDQGDQPREITAQDGPIPGGGNLVLRRNVFHVTGQFSTALGPQGHDLGGGEDSEFVLRAMSRGARCQYSPEILQHHYVDTERLKLGYLLRKSYQRSRSISRIHGNGNVPLYMWRKLAVYGLHSVFSISWAKRRFFWIRTAAAMGEVQGSRESGHRGNKLELPPDQGTIAARALALVVAGAGLSACVVSGPEFFAGLLPALSVATVGTGALLAKSLSDFSQTGPRIREEVLNNYRLYTLFALARLSLWAFVVMLAISGAGILAYCALNVSFGQNWSPWLATLAGLGALIGASAIQLVRKLRFNPGLLVASMHYRMSRLHALWHLATPSRIRFAEGLLGFLAALLVTSALWTLLAHQKYDEMLSFAAATVFFVGILVLAAWSPEAGRPARSSGRSNCKAPNILMIGSDTLRADRLSALGYHRRLTPNIDSLAANGVLFANCYVPCARTAPSLVSLLTGAWPSKHGIRDNFIADTETRLKVDSLPQLLSPLGYRTAAVSDWCGADMGKLSFGFDFTDLPEDQWNLKYFIRQGPKDIRLFLSLFTHNQLGRIFLPELFYLGGVPLTSQLGKRARRLVSRLASTPAPFFLNVFYSTTHPPFASEWPWYGQFSDPDYGGESKFAMAKLTDPFDIIRRQGAPKEEFDLDQIIDLYDGCVRQFDNEVGLMLQHLDNSGLADNTIVVVYSDHGMEFFEHGTWGQGNSAVGDFSARIPLIIRDPRTPVRRVVDEVVRSIDLAPTLLDLAGADPSLGMDGVSLAACFTQPEFSPKLDAINETGIWLTDIPGLPDKHLRYPDLFELIEVPDREKGNLAIKARYQISILQAKDWMIRRGDWKLVYQPLESGFQLRLFNIALDPDCLNDVADAQKDKTSELWQRLQTSIRVDQAPVAT